MNVQEIIKFFKNNSDARGIPNIPHATWLEFINNTDKDTVRHALADYVIDNGISFPLSEITTEEFEELFIKFAKTSMLAEFKEVTPVLEKHPYKYAYADQPLGVIDKSHAYNSVSNYFQQQNRMQCASVLVPSPWAYWHNRELLAKMNWHFWRVGALVGRDINAGMFREAFRIGTYTATQFRPSVAKAIYERHAAKHVLDTSCGWGDRLAGFYATPCTKTYVGCDPNPEVYAKYKEQCLAYERIQGHTAQLTEYDNYFVSEGSKTVTIYNLPSEDVDWHQYADTFDCYFTSPPYYATEKYAETTDRSDQQSWARYPTFEEWKHRFFFPVNRSIWATLKSGAYFMLNIVEPVNGKYKLCDDMVDDILTYPVANYLGKIGMRLQARPHSIVQADKNAVFVEPIWVFRKGLNKYDIVEATTFNQLFEFS